MNFTNPANAKHPLVSKYNAAIVERDVAIRAQWAAAANVPLFNALHRAATIACKIAIEAEQGVYDAGLAFAPYWHVTPAQMKSYAKNGTAMQREVWGV